MLPVWGLWPVFVHGSALELLSCPGPLVPWYLLKNLFCLKDMDIFPPIFLMTWVLIKWPILHSETELIVFPWILSPSIGAEFLVFELPVFWGRSSVAPQRWELIFISWMMIQMAIGDCRNHSSRPRVYKSEIIITIWRSHSTLILILNSFSLLTKLCIKVVASSRI